MEADHKVPTLIFGLLLCQMVVALPALTIPATITVNSAAGSGGVSGSSDQISSSIGSGIQTAAQQLVNGELSSQNGQLNVAGLGASVNLDGLTGQTSGSMTGLASNSLGLSSGSLRPFSLTSTSSGNGAGISSTFGTFGSNGEGSASSAVDAENLSQGALQNGIQTTQVGIQNGAQQLSSNGQLATNFAARTQNGLSFDGNGQRILSFGSRPEGTQNGGFSFDGNSQRILSFGSRPEGAQNGGLSFDGNSQRILSLGSRPEGTQNGGLSFDGNSQQFVSFSSRPEGSTVPQGSWFVDVGALGDTTSTPNPINRLPELNFQQPTWSARQQVAARPPIAANYLQDYSIVPSRPASTVYYTVPEGQSQQLSAARSLGYVSRGGDGLQIQYARNGVGAYSGPITGQGYLPSGQLIPAQQFQLAF